MKAVLLNSPGDFSIADLPTPEPGPGEVRLRIEMSGICTNDIRDFKGECSYTYPRIGGHEYGGTIEKLGEGIDSSRYRAGQKAVAYIIDNCKSCYLCKRGEENICETLPTNKTFQNPGAVSGYKGFAQYVIAKVEDLFIYPEETDFKTIAFTEPLACVVNSVNRTPLRMGDDALVIGGGTMGLLHVMVARVRGARVILSEPLAERREKALRLGAAFAFDPGSEDVQAQVASLTSGRGADIVYNTTAAPAIAEQAIAMTAPGGTVVMFSSIHPNTPVPVDLGRVHSHQVNITGAVSPTIRAYHESVMLLSKRIIDPTSLIEAVYSYRDFGDAMACAMRPDTYKVLLDFGDAG
ncbi:alcohol dehydrogenase catalytic domain-containing protein [Selenomonas sp. TAMA-11512]|uniref:zinc-dependent alcohol dehydrogenase n=1 Tax=Selenomonas sp. TAMA-11512 TaxID=3095337 RepID=UPI0030919596|nr:alcohol dehydrogenase catalytic domain-containing protein [Selenomonas sp. TAMA-11512]